MVEKSLVVATLLMITMSALPAYAISNGQIADWPEYAYVGAVDEVEGNFYFTVGSSVLITPNWVLTAAHVVDRVLPSGTDFAIRFGDAHYEISSIILHPDHDTSGMVPADLALLELATPVESIAPAVLLDRGAVGLTLSAEQITLAGYGMTSDFSNDAGTLRIGETFINYAEDMYYATRPGYAVAYPGDSGGPSFLYDGRQNTVVGIHYAYISGGPDPWTHYNVEIVPSAFRSFIDSYVPGVTWGERHYRTAEGPAQWAEMVVTQAGSILRGEGAANGSLIYLTGDTAVADPVGQWGVSAPQYADNGTEQWGMVFASYDQDTNTFHPLDADLEYAIALNDIDWLGYDPIHGVPRSLLSSLATLMLYDMDFNVIYTGQIGVSLTDDDFLSMAFRPADRVLGLTEFSGFALSDITVVAVPEPATAALLACGLLLMRRRRQSRI